MNYREPAITATSLLAPLVGMIVLLVAGLSAEQQAVWNAVAVAVAGLITAAIVIRERLAPAIMGLAQAVLALLAVYGFGLSAEQSTGVMAFVAVAVGAYVRTQVSAAPENPALHVA